MSLQELDIIRAAAVEAGHLWASQASFETLEAEAVLAAAADKEEERVAIQSSQADFAMLDIIEEEVADMSYSTRNVVN
jgi:hypothetical protein